METSDTPTAAAPPLAAFDVERAFRIGDRSLKVLHGVSMDLARGERLALMGTSGAGKTTLLNILGLLDTPSAGEVRVDGVETWTLSQRQRARLRNEKIGFIFQFYHLLPELSAVENALLPAMITHGRAGYRRRRDEYRARAVGMLERFGLGDRLDHRPGQMSGGEQQRVAIARALLLDPPILIADEPTGNLDSQSGEKVLELLLDEQRERGVSLLLVTHDERLGARCDRVLRMEDGRIVDQPDGAPIG